VPPASTTIDGVACPTSSVCVAVGYYLRYNATFTRYREIGVTYRTADGGETWRLSARATYREPLTSIACLSTTTCLATVGTHGSAVLRTTNDAATWLATTSSPALDWSVSCGTASRCVAGGTVGGRSYFSRSTDAGRTWSGARAIPGRALSVSCTSARRCWALVQAGPFNQMAWTIETVDGGATWIRRSATQVAETGSVACGPTACVESLVNGGPSEDEPLVVSRLLRFPSGGGVFEPVSLPSQAADESAVAVVPGTTRFLAAGSGALNGPLVVASP
jgi:photosystem II stability/assembly factor-like uncharacterized protein